MYENGYAVDSTRFNQADRRKNGVINFKPSEYSATTGPLAVTEGASTSAIELEYNGGTARIDQEPVDVTPGTVGLPPGDPDHPREDVLFVADDGTVQVLPGKPADNEIVDMNGEPYAPLGPQMPVPEPNDTAGLSGTILASVTVPAGASTSDDVPQSVIHDRRRQALKRPYEGWLAPALNTDFLAYEPEDFRNWPFAVWGGWTFRLWSYTFMQPANGVVEIGPGFDLHLQLIDYEANNAGSPPSGDTGLVWTREPQQTGSPQQGEPIMTIDTDPDRAARCYAFRVINEGDFSLTGEHRVAVQARYTIEPTGWRRNE